MSTPSIRILAAVPLCSALLLVPAAQAGGLAPVLLDYGLEALNAYYGNPDSPCDAPGATSPRLARGVVGGTLGLVAGVMAGMASGDVTSGMAGALKGKQVMDTMAIVSRARRTPLEARDAQVCEMLRAGRQLLLPAVDAIYRRHGLRCGLSMDAVKLDNVHAAQDIQDCLRDDAAARDDLLGFRSDVIAQNASTCRAIVLYLARWDREQAATAGGGGTRLPQVPLCPVDPR